MQLAPVQLFSVHTHFFYFAMVPFKSSSKRFDLETDFPRDLETDLDCAFFTCVSLLNLSSQTIAIYALLCQKETFAPHLLLYSTRRYKCLHNIQIFYDEQTFPVTLITRRKCINQPLSMNLCLHPLKVSQNESSKHIK